MIKNPFFSRLGRSTIKDLQLEYMLYQLHEAGKEAVIVIGNAFTAALEKLLESFKEIYEIFGSVIIKDIQNRSKWYNPIDRNNYRKIHHMALRRVLRKRQRESKSRYLPKATIRTEAFEETEEE